MSFYPDFIAAAERVADKLIGTPDNLTFVLEELGMDGFDNNSTFCATLDARVFCCAVCDWWHDVGDTGNDVNGEWACVECGGGIE